MTERAITEQERAFGAQLGEGIDVKIEPAGGKWQITATTSEMRFAVSKLFEEDLPDPEAVRRNLAFNIQCWADSVRGKPRLDV